MERVWIVSAVLMALALLSNGFTLVAMLSAIGKIHSKSAPELHALITDEGPGIHSPLPDFAASDIDGELVSNDGLHGHEVVILLLSPDCMPCDRIMKGLPATIRGMLYCPELLIVLEASSQITSEYARRYRLPARLVADEEASIRTQLGISSTPYAFLVDEDGIIRMKGVVDTGMRLEGLASRRGRYMGRPSWHVVNMETP